MVRAIDNGQFSEPNIIAIDPAAGRLYVAEFLNNRVQVFDLDGNFIDKWGSLGSGNGQFVQPAGIAVDANGLVFVGDTNNGTGGRVQIFDAFGTWQRCAARYLHRGLGNGVRCRRQPLCGRLLEQPYPGLRSRAWS